MTGFLWAAVGVAAANLLAVALIVARSSVYGTRLYKPMLVNVGLSLVPVIAAVAVVAVPLAIAFGAHLLGPAVPALIWSALVVTAGLWLLFFPNSAYLITELNFSHRRSDDPVPLWFDIVQTLSLVVSGLSNAVFSLCIIQLTLWAIIDDAASRPPAVTWVIAIIALVLGAVGVYLGRYLRFNSWDVRHPSSFVKKTRTYFAPRGRVLDFFGFTLTHALLLAVLYVPAAAILSLAL